MVKFLVFIWSSAILFYFAVSADAKEVTCNYEDVNYLPHPNCSKFYVCDHGHLTELECPKFLYFNPSVEVCDYPINVPECEGGTREPGYTPPITSPTPPVTTETIPPPVATTTTTTAPLPTTSTTVTTTTTTEIPTTSTLSTTKEPSTTTSTSPPITTSTTTTSTTSAPSTSAPPQSTITLPNGCPSCGVAKIPHPLTCERYIICINGVPYEVHCTNGLQFNPVKEVCDLPENVNCSFTPAPPPSTTPSSAFPECPPEGSSFHALPGNCSFYIVCTEGFPMIQKCVDGTCFSEEHLKCEVPPNAEAPQSIDTHHSDSACKNNMDEIKLFPSHESCMKYHICFGLQYKGQQDCKPGKHFHFFTQNCIAKEFSECDDI